MDLVPPLVLSAPEYRATPLFHDRKIFSFLFGWSFLEHGVRKTAYPPTSGLNPLCQGYCASSSGLPQDSQHQICITEQSPGHILSGHGSRIQRRVVSKEHADSIFKVKEQTKKSPTWHMFSPVSLLSFLKRSRLMASQRSLCQLPPPKLLSQLNDFHEIWYKHYATGGYPKVALYNIMACRTVARQRPRNKQLYNSHC
jgi:hypothetical protein